MSRRSIISILLFSSLNILSWSQTETYSIKKAPFSTDQHDEFSPVFYKNGLIFCSNRSVGKIGTYSNSQNKGFFKIYYSDTVESQNLPGIKLFSRELTTRLNDGPVTFSPRGDTVYFSRNLIVEGKPKELSSTRNKLGIFYAVWDGTKWTKVREMRINDEWYNVTTPCLSPDGNILYVASDKPGGFGGSDIYYSERKGDYWHDLVNLGPVINTKGNETNPFISPAGELYFSSDGHPGMGGKDIFFSAFIDSAWITPVRLDAPVNSQYDDFGFITDEIMDHGYFSSNRNKSIDIFSFRTTNPQIFYTTLQKNNQYCFTFRDSGSIYADTVNLMYRWDFGDGKSARGAVVRHCYGKPGNYNVRLDIVERGPGNVLLTKLDYELELSEYKQGFINSHDVAVKGDAIEFDGLKSNLPGYKVLKYLWDFGDGNRSGGEKVSHAYKEAGEYSVNLGLVLRSDSTGRIHKTGVSKKVLIFNNIQEGSKYLDKSAFIKTGYPDIRHFENALINMNYSAEEEYSKDAVFTVELLSSRTKIRMNSTVFKNVPKKYTLREKFYKESGIYSYIIDQQINLMAAYPSYREMRSLGFRDVRIKMVTLTDPAEKELLRLIKVYGENAESYFEAAERLTANAYIMLDQIVKLMNKYPTLRLQITVHSDNTGSEAKSLALTQRQAQALALYLINRGINANRLVATGFGGIRPIASNLSEKERKQNQRIEFIKISD